MPRKRTFKCRICGEPKYKYELVPFSIHLSKRGKNGIKESYHYRANDLCSNKSCRKIWEQQVLEDWRQK